MAKIVSRSAITSIPLMIDIILSSLFQTFAPIRMLGPLG